MKKFCILLLSVAAAACASTAPNVEITNKEINRRFVQEVYAEHRLDRIPAYVHPDFVDRSAGAPPEAHGVDYVVKQAQGSFAMLPDVKMEIVHLVAEGDLVSVHWRATGNSADKKPVDFQGISLFRMQDGKIIESWDLVDRMSMLRQLGFTITPPAK
ncbi:MAG TPA: ester cyclase [Thermoanaerobaculia bacterium]|nr:ester cyclase [Thermoanaerobaculia bacterium]